MNCGSNNVDLPLVCRMELGIRLTFAIGDTYKMKAEVRDYHCGVWEVFVARVLGLVSTATLRTNGA